MSPPRNIVTRRIEKTRLESDFAVTDAGGGVSFGSWMSPVAQHRTRATPARALTTPGTTNAARHPAASMRAPVTTPAIAEPTLPKTPFNPSAFPRLAVVLRTSQGVPTAWEAGAK